MWVYMILNFFFKNTIYFFITECIFYVTVKYVHIFLIITWFGGQKQISAAQSSILVS